MKPETIDAVDAKTRLSELLARVEQGARYIITKRGRPVAALVPVARTGGLQFGCDAGRIHIADDFDAPLHEFEPYR